MTYVFVYGTLKKGYGNHSLLQTSKFIGEGVTTWCWYEMYDGSFPYVVFHGNGLNNAIKGEVYEVNDNTLRTLDHLEGVDYNHYIRHYTKVDVGSKSYDCVMYVASPSTISSLVSYRKNIGIGKIGEILSWR